MIEKNFKFILQNCLYHQARANTWELMNIYSTKTKFVLRHSKTPNRRRSTTTTTTTRRRRRRRMTTTMTTTSWWIFIQRNQSLCDDTQRLQPNIFISAFSLKGNLYNNDATNENKKQPLKFWFRGCIICVIYIWAECAEAPVKNM